MADETIMNFPQISRSGRIVKKSFKLKEFEDSIIEGIKVKSHRMSEDEMHQRVSSYYAPRALLHPQQRSRRKASSVRKSPPVLSRVRGFSQTVNTFSSHKRSRGNKNEVSASDLSQICGLVDSIWRAKEVLSPAHSTLSDSSEESSSSDSTSASSFESSDAYDIPNSEYRNIQLKENYASSEGNWSSRSQTEEDSNSDASVLEFPKGSKCEITNCDNSSALAARYYAPVQAPPKICARKFTRKLRKNVSQRPKYRRNTVQNIPNLKEAALVHKNARKVTSFTLWNRVNKDKIVALYKHLRPRQVIEKVREAWRAVSEGEKALWKRRAKQLSLRDSIDEFIHPDRSFPAAEIQEEASDVTDFDESEITPEESAILGSAPIDVAAHLKLLGDCISIIGENLLQSEDEVSPAGVYSVLLDTALYSIGSLLCLTREITGLENLPEDNFLKILDHIAYFLPGFNPSYRVRSNVESP